MNVKIKELETIYKVVQSNNFYELEQQVTKRIKNGWQLTGGVCLAYNEATTQYLFCQSMTRIIFKGEADKWA